MNLVERIFVLKQQPCFALQTDFDLARIAEVATEKTYEPGTLLCAAGQTLRRVYIVAAGCVVAASGETMPRILGPASLLLDAPVREDLSVGNEGASCLLLEKGVFFTIVYQCPSIVRELLKADTFEVPVKQETRPAQ